MSTTSAEVPNSGTGNRNAYLAIWCTIIFWASAFVTIRIGLHSYSPGAMALLRYLIASAIITVIYYKFSPRRKPSLKEFMHLFAVGLAGIGIYNIAINYCEQTIPAGIASFVVSLVPIFTIVLAYFVLKERLSKRAWFGVAISISGVGVIAIGEHSGTEFDIGIIWLLFAAFVCGIYVVLQKPLFKKFTAIEVTSFAIWTGTLSLLIYTPEMIVEVQQAAFQDTLAVIYMAIFPGIIAYFTWSYALSQLPASKATSQLYATPIVGISMGMLLLAEYPPMLSIVGGLIALGGAIIANKK